MPIVSAGGWCGGRTKHAMNGAGKADCYMLLAAATAGSHGGGAVVGRLHAEHHTPVGIHRQCLRWADEKGEKTQCTYHACRADRQGL